MPASRSIRFGPRWHFVFTLLAVMLVVCARVEAQTGAVTFTAHVSETVALSISPSFNPENINSNVVRSGNTVRLTLSSARGEAPVIRVPLLVRSNTDFKISAVVDSATASIGDVSVVNVRATGTLVSRHAVTALDVLRQSDLSEPLLVLTGPRVSLGGTLNSPNNALQITLLIRLQPQPDHAWSLQLTFVGAPG